MRRSEKRRRAMECSTNELMCVRGGNDKGSSGSTALADLQRANEELDEVNNIVTSMLDAFSDSSSTIRNI